MSSEEIFYNGVGDSLKGAEKSQMFGKPCYKTGGKAFISFFENSMVFKLTGEPHAKALALKGARQFDPSGKGRPMKEWVQVDFSHKNKWKDLAEEALDYVRRANG
jgi:hypothetical protein